jgi:tRNA(Ile)-lysidine synthase
LKRTPLTSQTESALRRLGLPSGSILVVGLSGGPDSLALTDALASLAPALGLTVLAAHLDHGLREESAAEAQACAEACRNLGVDLVVERADVRATARKRRLGLEEAGRAERLAFLRRVAKSRGAAAIALAHTRDDQAETLLLRLLRGAGPLGLGAMAERRDDLVRPLLSTSRAEVLVHLERRGLTPIQDPSNADPGHRRNRVRHELIPYLEARFNPRIREALASTAGLVREQTELLAQQAARLLGEASSRRPDGFWLEPEPLSAAPLPLAREAVRQALQQLAGEVAVGRRHVDGVLALLGTSGRRLALPGGQQASSSFGAVRLAAPAQPVAAFEQALEVPGTVDLPDGGRLQATPVDGPGAAVVAAPAGPLVVRRRRPGDRLARRDRSVSLKRFLSERRIPLETRDRLPLVACGSRVLWWPGAPPDALPATGERFVHLQMVGDPGATP